jgi:catechol 2,3-dioxygenase-like lactoylglutathione lyase family enzyme
MGIQLDHFIVSSRDAARAAKTLGDLLGVPSGKAAAGPFHAVYLNEGLTLDFIDTQEAFPVEHYCFRVDKAQFDAILDRLKAQNIPFRGTPDGDNDMRIGAQYGNVYWDVPDGHTWEILTASYAREPSVS